MFDYTFESMGTHWSLSIDHQYVSPNVIEDIESQTKQFEHRFSRFIKSSESNQFRKSKAGDYPVSTELAVLLKAGQQLFELTGGAFDMSIASLFEQLGYDESYSFRSTKNIKWSAPKWSVNNELLSISGPVVFDVGGFGKGYWIDQISTILKGHNLPNHIVEGGGDMMATQKSDGSPWRVAIEYPGKPDLAISIVDLKNQGLAVSDVFKRKWQNWHHLINANLRDPIHHLIGNAAVASSAFIADQMTSALSFSKPTQYSLITQQLPAQYIVVDRQEQVHVSQKWPGELFE